MKSSHRQDNPSIVLVHWLSHPLTHRIPAVEHRRAGPRLTSLKFTAAAVLAAVQAEKEKNTEVYKLYLNLANGGERGKFEKALVTQTANVVLGGFGCQAARRLSSRDGARDCRLFLLAMGRRTTARRRP